jgi:acetyl-CoA synthetase (ADP-forming)
VVLVDDPVTMIRVADLVLRCPPPPADGIAILSGSGGGAGITADRIVGAGFRLARLSSSTRDALGELLLPPQADNPVDLGGRLPGRTDDIAAASVRTLTADPDVGVLLMYLTSMPAFEARTRILASEALATGKPVLTLMLPGPAASGPRRILRELGCPYFDSAEDLLTALRGLLDHHRMKTEINAVPVRPADLPSMPPALHDLPGLAAAYGIAVPGASVCETSAQALEKTEAFGFPVVLKGIVTDVTHKTDLGLVKTGLNDAAAVEAAWWDIVSSIADHGLTRSFTGCLLQQQIAPGLELIASLRNDPLYGPFVLVGAGGTLVELLRDVAQAPAPLSAVTARRMVRNLRIAPLLEGWRGNPARDVEAVVDALVRLSWLAVDLGERVIDLEINPLIVGQIGDGVRAVDIRANLGGQTWKD